MSMKMRSDKRELDKLYKRRDRYEIPDWQRDEVWDLPRRQKLIDSILRGWRLPKFYFFATGSQTYEVVDGQQRLATIFEFLSGELALSEETATEFGGGRPTPNCLRTLRTKSTISRSTSTRLATRPTMS